ncbi:MAG: prepilin peptidase [Alphaproteobacteria bacterium]
MILTSPIHAAVVVLFGALLAAAAFMDVRTFAIPNRLSVAVLALYPAHVLASPLPVDWQAGLVVGIAVFIVCTVIFSLGWMGGGDVKLLTAAAVWAGPELLPHMLFLVAAIGGLHSLLEMIRLGYPRRIWLRFVRAESAAPTTTREIVPYGVAISAGGLFIAASQLIATI